MADSQAQNTSKNDKSALSPIVWGSVTTGWHQGVSLVLDMQKNWVNYFIWLGVNGLLLVESAYYSFHI